MTRTKAWARSVVISAGSPCERIAIASNAVSGLQITLLRHEHVNDLPVLIDGPVDVPVGAKNLIHVTQPGDIHG